MLTPPPNNTMYPYVLPSISVKNVMEIPKDAATSPLWHFPHCPGEMSILMEPLRNLLGCYILIPSTIRSCSSGVAPSEFHIQASRNRPRSVIGLAARSSRKVVEPKSWASAAGQMSSPMESDVFLCFCQDPLQHGASQVQLIQ